MIIADIESINSEGHARVTATIIWEDIDRMPFSVFMETTIENGKILWPEPNAFFLACVIPAWAAGEKRILVSGTLCPMLVQNIKAAFFILKFWFPEFGNTPVIETTSGFKVKYPNKGYSISLLSCGIDSLATLRTNTITLPYDHPNRIRRALAVMFDESQKTLLGKLNASHGRLQSATEVCNDVDVQLIPVNTNLWWLVNNGYFYDKKWHGSLLCAIAYFFNRSSQIGYIAASYDSGLLMKPWGSSPLLDPFFSSAHFRIEHNGTGLKRIEKTAIIAEWPVGLQNIRVCQKDGAGETSNCGVCEKCIRTMIALESLGKLQECNSFPNQEVSVEFMKIFQQYDMFCGESNKVEWYKELIPGLLKHGRDDLVSVIEQFPQ